MPLPRIRFTAVANFTSQASFSSRICECECDCEGGSPSLLLSFPYWLFSPLSLFLSSFLPFSGESKIHSFSFRFFCTREFLRFSFCFRDNGKKLKLFYYICMIRVFIYFWILYFYSKFVCDSNL